MMRIGIVGYGLCHWGGGVDFLRMVSESLCATGAPIDIHLLLPARGPRVTARRALSQVRQFAHGLLRGSSSSTTSHAASAASELLNDWDPRITVHAIDSGVQAVASATQRLQLDVVLPSILPLGTGPVQPWVGYLYDFQHRHLPHFFSSEEIDRRDHAFHRMLSEAPAVVVNSRAVANDALAFHPPAASRVLALPFSAAPKQSWLATRAAPGALGIDRPYFIICNQFWQHKDHGTAFKAFALLMQQWPDLALVCTGATGDGRNPDYFPSLMRQAAALGITKRLHVLGHIPKRDQIALLRGSIALVQPTLFEGGPGGGACYDAIALGVTSIVSDIAVNRELDEPEVHFFPVGNADALADLMEQALTKSAHPASDETLIKRGHARRVRCGQALLQAVEIARTARGAR